MHGQVLIPEYRCWHADGRARRVGAFNPANAIAQARAEALAETDGEKHGPTRERRVRVVRVERLTGGQWKTVWQAAP